jgi:LysM repeat protein
MEKNELVKRLYMAFLAALLLAAVLPTSAQAQDQTVHVIQAGENLFRLALRYGTTVQAIVEANGLADPHSIQAGQRLIIPDGDGSASSAGPAMTTGGTYVVQSGDTLIGIAFRYGLSAWELMQANGLDGPHLIFVGQKIIIPGAGGSVPESLPEMGDTYVVRPGDTLTRIALRFDTTAFVLAQANGISDPALIRVGQVLRVPRATSAPEQPALPSSGSKRILIDLSEQHLYAYQGDQLLYSFVCSSGRAPYYTRTGQFQVQSKIPNAYGGAWNIWMPHWLGIYWAGGSENGIHALPIMQNGQTLWAGYLGVPISYGCIVLGTYEAKLLYDWAQIGTPVSIRN